MDWCATRPQGRDVPQSPGGRLSDVLHPRFRRTSDRLMATKLKGLVIDRVDFVDKGANPGAHIVIAKRETTVEKQDFKCANCGATFDTKQQLEAHMAEEKDKG